MSERKRFFADGAMLTVVALAMRSASMLFSSFISKSVGSEGVGLFTVIMTVYSLALTLATSGISLTVTRLVAAAREGEKRSILRGAVAYSLIFGACGAVLLFTLSDTVSVHILSEPRAALPLRLLSFSLIFVSLGAVFNGYFVGVKRVKFNAVAQIFGQCVKILACILLVSAFGGGDVYRCVVSLALGITATEIASFVLIFVLYVVDSKKIPLGEKGSSKTPPALRKVSETALPLAFSQYFRSVLLTAEHVLIPRCLMYRGDSNSQALSSYGTLHGMALPAVLFPMSPLSSYSGLLVPEFAEDESRGNNERMSKITSEALSVTLSYGICAAVFMLSFSQEIGYTLYGTFESGYYVRFLAPVIPIMYLDHVTDQILKGIGEQVYSMWVNIADSCLSLLLVCLLIPKMGISGYAIIIILMEGFNFSFSIIRLVKRVKVKLPFVRAVVIPMVEASAACLLSDLLFRFGGAATKPVWLLLKIIFGISVLVFLDNFIKTLLCNPHKKKKMTKK